MDAATLAQELQKVMATGDEAATMRFVVEHFKEFPEETHGAQPRNFFFKHGCSPQDQVLGYL